MDVDCKVATCLRTQVKNGKVLIDLTLDEEVEVPKKQVVEVVDLTKDSDTESESSLDSTHTITKKPSHSTTDYSSSDNHWTRDSDSDSDVSRSSSIGFRFYSGLRHWMISPTTDTDVNTDSDDRRKSWDDKESNTTTDDSDDMGERLVLLHYHYYDMTENSQLFERQKRWFHLAKVVLSKS